MQKDSTGTRDAALGLGAVVLMVVCCAGPALIAAGVLAGIGRFIGSPIVIAGAVVLALVAVTAVVRRRRRDECCPPAQQQPTGDARIDGEVR